MRDVNGESRAANNTLETINAAATAIASAENRVPQATVQVVVINFVFNNFIMLEIRSFKLRSSGDSCDLDFIYLSFPKQNQSKFWLDKECCFTCCVFFV